MTRTSVALRDVHYRYADGTPALQGVSLCIAQGEAVGIVGANGAGKSTLLLHLNGCLKASSGEVLIDDLLLGLIPVSQKTLANVRAIVGLLMQDPDDQLFMPTVGEDVAFGVINDLRHTPQVTASNIEEIVSQSLATVGAAHLRDRPPWRLSGGEKRAVAIAAVLAMKPHILAFDEPTASLDPRARRHCIDLLKSFPQTRIVASHDLDMILDVCPRVVVLDHGRVAADGPSAEIFRDAPLLERCGLELPLRLQACPNCQKTSLP